MQTNLFEMFGIESIKEETEKKEKKETSKKKASKQKKKAKDNLKGKSVRKDKRKLNPLESDTQRYKVWK